MLYNWTGDKLNSDSRIDVGELEEILSNADLHDIAWEIVALRKRLEDAGVPAPGGLDYDGKQ